MTGAIAKIQRLDRQMRRLGAPSPEDVRRKRRAPLPAALPGDGSFRAFVEHVNPTLLAYEHVERLLSVGQRVADGELTRVLVFLAPRHFKSEIFSRLLPAYYLLRHPARQVGLASYGAQLAWDLAREARDYFSAAGGTLDAAASAVRNWYTSAGGRMWSDGVGGSLLGRGYHLGVIDDPQDPEQARSVTYQARFKRWYPGKFYSRREPGAAIVVVMQRLGLDDAAAFLLQEEADAAESGRHTQNWHVVVADAVRSDEPYADFDGEMGLPVTCTVEPDERPVGAPLAPSRFSLAEYERTRDASGPAVWDAQQQQRPAALTGDFWRREWFGVYDELPAGAFAGGDDWDTAFTRTEANAASARVRSFTGAPGTAPVGAWPDGTPYALPPKVTPVYIDDVDWRWAETPELVAWMRSEPGPHYVEDKASGKSAAPFLRREGVAVETVAVAGDKLARASSVQPVVAARRVFVRRAVLDRLLEGEKQGLLRVTVESLVADSGWLDVNDAFVQALIRHARTRPRARRMPGTVINSLLG